MSSQPPMIPVKKRILVVDDDDAARLMLTEVLEENYDVLVASDGLDGIASASATPPDLIVTDVNMPRLDGVAMVRHIRESQGLKVPVIFLTAMDSPQHVITGIAAGARHYMTKPVDFNQLERRIARALGREAAPSDPPRR